MLRHIYRHPFLFYLLFLLPALLAVFRLGLFPHHLLYTELVAALLPVLLALLFYIPITLHLSAASLRSWNEGDPSPLLTHSLDSIHLYRQSRRTSAKRALANFHINAAAALISLGRFSQALEHLDAASSLPLTGEAAAILWLNRSAALYELGRYQEMAPCLSQAEALLSASGQAPTPQTAALWDAVRRSLRQHHLLLRLQTQVLTPEVETELQELLTLAKTPKDQVELHLALAQCALARRDNPAAQEHLSYVLAHGNKLHARTQAAELWAQQGFPPSTEPPA